MSKIMYKDKPYMSTTDLPEMTLTEVRTGTEEEPRVISPKTLFEFAVNRLTGNIDLDTSAASGDDHNLTQALTSLGWLSEVVTSGVLGGKKLLYKILQKLNELTEKNYTVETLPLTFSSGSATVPKKSGYVLVSAYPRNRTDSGYGITDWTEQTNGSYVLVNKYASLNAEMSVRIVWVKDY